jgi:GH25 family lysozyme M1 (1,4-beta-N-acetylmuramidase)
MLNLLIVLFLRREKGKALYKRFEYRFYYFQFLEQRQQRLLTSKIRKLEFKQALGS